MLLAAIDLMPQDLVHYIGYSAGVEEWPTVAVFRMMEERSKSEEGSLERALDADDSGFSAQLFETKASVSLSKIRRRRVGRVERRGKHDARDLTKPGMPACHSPPLKRSKPPFRLRA